MSKVQFASVIQVFCYTSERERHLQLTVKSKHTSAPIGCAIFSRIWKDKRQLQEFEKLKHACVPIGRAIFN
jgi:hypothetical protein